MSDSLQVQVGEEAGHQVELGNCLIPSLLISLEFLGLILKSLCLRGQVTMLFVKGICLNLVVETEVE